MGFAWPIVYMRARRLYDSPRRPYQLKYFHGDSPAALCAPHAPPPIWIGTPEVTSTRGGYSMRFSMRHVFALDGWIFSREMGILEDWRRFFFSFLPFLFFSLRGNCYWELDGTNGCLVEGECRILFQGEILLLYYKVYKCWTIGLSKLFEIFIREMYVCGECRLGLKRCYSL